MFCTLLIKNFCSIKSKLQLIMNNQKGVTAVIVAIVAAVLIAFAALAIDVGYIYATRNELQNVADAAALAGCGELGRIYLGLTAAQQDGYTLTTNNILAIQNAAKNVASKNKAATENITIDDGDIVIGTWDFHDPPTLPNPNPTSIESDAVQVKARRDSTSEQGAVATFFARILSIFGGSHDTFTVSAVATAALSGPSTIGEGELKVPFGVSKNNFPDNCGILVTFEDTNDSCAGWHNFFDPHDTPSIRKQALGLIAGDTTPRDDSGEPVGILNGANWLTHYFATTETPTVIGDVDINDEEKNKFDFTGGVGPFLDGIHIEWEDANGMPAVNGDTNPVVVGTGQIAPFPALFDYYRMRDGDDDNSKWTSTVPVYDDGVTCSNPSGDTKLVGFAIVEIFGYKGPPDNNIDVIIECSLLSIDEGRSGGGPYGNIMGSIPNLVQ